jgi:hypothetical protein
MNYLDQLSKEHSRANTDEITRSVGNDPDEFKKIIAIIYTENAPLPQRASWILASVNDRHPELLHPYLSKFIESIKQFKVDGIKRNMTKVLASHNIPQKLQGKLLNLCYDLMLSSDETVVVKVHAMQCIANIAKYHPGLKNELKSAIEDQLPKTSAAFYARAKQISKELKMEFQK